MLIFKSRLSQMTLSSVGVKAFQGISPLCFFCCEGKTNIFNKHSLGACYGPQPGPGTYGLERGSQA